MSNSDEHLIKVFIVDDEPLIRMDLREMLHESLVYKVVGEAKDGSEALELIKQAEPDIIFMDVRMPKQDGITTAKQIQENSRIFVCSVNLGVYYHFCLLSVR